MIEPGKYVNKSTRLGDSINFAAFKNDIDETISELREAKKKLPKVVTKAKRLAKIVDKFLWLDDNQAQTKKGKELERRMDKLEKEVVKELEDIGILSTDRGYGQDINWDGIRIKE